MSKPTLPYDYARCGAEDCPLEKTCLRKTPGHPTYQAYVLTQPSETCKYYIGEDEWK